MFDLVIYEWSWHMAMAVAAAVYRVSAHHFLIQISVVVCGQS